MALATYSSFSSNALNLYFSIPGWDPCHSCLCRENVSNSGAGILEKIPIFKTTFPGRRDVTDLIGLNWLTGSLSSVKAYLLSTARAKVSIQRRATSSLIVEELGESALSVLNLDFLFLNDKVSSSKTTRDFATVGTMTYVTSSSGEQIAIVNRHFN